MRHVDEAMKPLEGLPVCVDDALLVDNPSFSERTLSDETSPSDEKHLSDQTSLPKQRFPITKTSPQSNSSNAKGRRCVLTGSTIDGAGTSAALKVQSRDEVHPYIRLWAISTLLTFAGTIIRSLGAAVKALGAWEEWEWERDTPGEQVRYSGALVSVYDAEHALSRYSGGCVC